MASNASFVPITDAWSGYVHQAQAHLPSSSRLVLLALVNVPLIIVLLNAAWQVLKPKDPSLPPVVFHWLPIIGSAIQYGNDPINFFLKCREKYGDVFTFILFGRRMVVALGPKGNNFVTGGRVSQLSAEEAYTHLTTPVFGKDVVYDVPNEVLMEQKKFVKFGLSLDNFRAYIGMIEQEVENFLNNDPGFRIWQMNDINEWGSFHAFKTLAEITILTASRTLQGKEVRSSLDKSFADLYHDLDGGFTPVNFLFPNLPLESYKKRDKAQQTMSDFYVDLIRKRREGKDTDAEHDIISALMSQRYKNGRELSDREIAHIMIALLMAGQHTSSTTGTWAILHLADNPEVAEALYQEQVEHFGIEEGKFRQMTYEELKDLPILDSVIRETLRLHPPIHSIIRKVVSDAPVPPSLAAPSKDGSYVVPKGYFVLSSPAVSQVDPKVWPNALEWEPSRWSDAEGFAAQAYKTYADENGEKVDYGFGAVSKGTESPYQPFGAGRHRCIGEQFAYLQIGTILSTIIRKVELRLEGKMPAHNYHTMITTPKDPCDIRYRRRHFD
ncbi:lanosterol 14-alpha-demethylase [Fomitiporia mediterranea MF3/22]|uniref:lanosterol 14-alpha-demethylase n=1 Tax=Fomitiporia mediterranea (strain MF3/22) TaxID=694068 RepID=UPI0004407ECF|nr:lanosterol 14-alpha-demethylase [Fomitiporia mediterranea MF3/22]EJD06923.1 lanosterol 14-alpha-demethylase [Fomitiporia mediterranea MF3/22]